MPEIFLGNSEGPQPDNTGHLEAARELPIPGSESVVVQGERRDAVEGSVEDVVARLKEKFVNTPELDNVNIYDALRLTLAAKTKGELKQMVGELKGGDDELISECADAIIKDLFLKDFALGHKSPDIVGNGTAFLVEDYLARDTKEIDSEQIEKALSLTIKNALYKTSQWRFPSEDLERIIKIVRASGDNGASINLDKVGITELKNTLVQLIASIDADLEKHPNYAYSGNGFLPKTRREYALLAETISSLM